MKKLLTLLGAIGLVASTGLTVIACGSKVPDDEGPIDEGNHLKPEEVKSKMEAEFNNILSKVMSKNMSQFTTAFDLDSAETSRFNFYNLPFLIDEDTFQFTNDPDPTAGKTEIFEINNIDNSVLIESLKEDLKILLPQSDFEQEIKSIFETGPNHELYRKYFKGVQETLGDFSIEATKGLPVKVARTRSAAKEQKPATELFSIEFVFSKQMNYRDFEGEDTTTTTPPRKTTISIGEKSGVIQQIIEISETLPKLLFEMGNGETNLTSQKLYGASTPADQKEFKTYGVLDKPIATYLNSSEFRETLKKKIEGLLTDQGIQVGFKEGVEIVSKEGVNTKRTMFGWEGSNIWNQSKYLTDGEKNSMLNRLLFMSNKEDYISKEDAIKQLKNIIVGYNETFDDFGEGFLKYIETIDGDANETNMRDIQNKIYTYGDFQLSGIEFVISENGDKNVPIPIATMLVPWTYSNNGLVEDSKTKEQEDKGDAFLGSVYESLIEVNKRFLQINSDKSKITSNMFTIPPTYKVDEEDKDKPNTSFLDALKISLGERANPSNPMYGWDKVMGMINKNQNVWLHGGWVNLGDKDTFKFDPKFHFNGFKIGVNVVERYAYSLKFKKIGDGDSARYGIGLDKKYETNNSIMTLKINLGQTRIQTHIFDGYKSELQDNYMGDGEVVSGDNPYFYGGDDTTNAFTFNDYIKQINANWSNFLMVEFSEADMDWPEV